MYDPLNPDKETLTLHKTSKKERLDNEFWLLEKLSQLLEKAHFYELPVEDVRSALKEHDAGDGVLVSVTQRNMMFCGCGLLEKSLNLTTQVDGTPELPVELLKGLNHQ